VDSSKKIDDGGPAFPIPVAMCQNVNGEAIVIDSQDRCVGGLSLRDYFAAKAMAAMIDSSVHSESFADFHDGSAQTYAAKAYIMADAMLLARKSQ